MQWIDYFNKYRIDSVAFYGYRIFHAAMAKGIVTSSAADMTVHRWTVVSVQMVPTCSFG